MEQYGNKATFNLESVLVKNIKDSLYYVKQALDLDHVHEVIDEIYEKVDHVEPWLSGNARGPSTAFCLLFRLAELKPSPPEIREMLDHKDSPYIRAIALLYLRYCCDPRDLWGWFKKYVRDTEEFVPSPSGLGKQVTVGTFARDILLDQYYFETIFPRIPKTVGDEVREHFRDMGLPTKAIGNAGQGGEDRRGTDDGARRPASVKASLSVAFGQRAPNRAGTRELGRGMGSDQRLDRGRNDDRDRGRDRERDRDRDRGRERGWERGHRQRHWHDRRGGRSPSPRRGDDRDWRPSERERSRERGRARSFSRDRYGGGGASREGYRDRSRSRERKDAREPGELGSFGGRDEYRRRSRSRSRSRGRDARDARDVFKDRPVGAVPQAQFRNMY